MKIKELNPTTKEFKPIELVLTIESKRELELLWIFFNASPAEKANFCKATNLDINVVRNLSAEEIYAFNLSDIWSDLNEKLKQL